MKVLQIGKYYPPYRGGMESHLELLCALLKERVDLEVVVSNTVPRTSREVLGGVRVTRSMAATTLASTSLCPLLPLHLSSRSYDVAHLHLPNPMGSVAYLASVRPARHALVVTYQSDVVRQQKLKHLYAPVEAEVLRRASAILCTSPDYLRSSRTLEPFREKCRIVPLGIDLGALTPTQAALKSAADLRARHSRPIVLAVGRHVYYKGFDVAVRAMQHVDADLVFVGSGPLTGELKNIARELSLGERIHFAGNVDDLLPYYLAADVLVFPSIARSEAFGLVQVEAMACGLPVVNTSLDSGVPFVCRHEREGLTVPPENPEALAAALRRLLEDPSLRRRLGEAGKARAAEEFSGEVMARRTLAVYEDVVAALR